jgi:quercetin dioxygenase-like cupin family protein
MTFHGDGNESIDPAILSPEAQQAVWFLGSLARIRASGNDTAGRLALLEHHAERGYGSPVHRHLADEETFFVLDGELRVEVAGQAHAAGAGAVAFLPRQLPHAFVVTSAQAWYLTLHTPAGFDRFVTAAGTPATEATTAPADAPNAEELSAIASSFGIEIVGPPPMP